MKLIEHLQTKMLTSCILICGWIAFVPSTISQAAPRDTSALSPQWSNKTSIHGAPNHSLLSTLDPHLNEPSLSEFLFDSKVSAEMSQKYGDLNRSYDIRKNHDLLTQQEERDHHAEMSAFSRKAMTAYGRKHISEKLQKLEKVVQNTPGLAHPVAVVAAAAAIYTGREMKVKVNEETGLSAATNGPERKAHLNLNSPFINGNVAYQAAPANERSVDLLSNHETMKVSVSRRLPLWNLQSGLSYGASTETMTASLSKALNPNLTCVVDTAHSGRSDQVTQEAIKIFYGLNF